MQLFGFDINLKPAYNNEQLFASRKHDNTSFIVSQNRGFTICIFIFTLQISFVSFGTPCISSIDLTIAIILLLWII